MKPRMPAIFSVCVIALASAITSSASADVSGLQVRMTDDVAEIVIRSDASLGKPRVRSKRGEVEVWFPQVADNKRLSASGDGTAILRARMRPGMGVSAVLDIDVGGQRKVDASLVTVEANGDTTIVRIPRSQLPSVAPASTITPTVATGTTKVTTTSAPVVAAVSDKPAVERPVVASHALGTKPAKNDAKSTTHNPLASGGDSKLPIMLWMTLVLGAILGGIKLWQRKPASLLKEPDIEVVATKRLGPGLQLFIVRAFGQEHLLSVNGKTTERIATNDGFEDFDSAAAAIRPAFMVPNEPGMQLTPSRSVLSNSATPTRSQAALNNATNATNNAVNNASMLDVHIPSPVLRPMSAPRSTPLSASQSIAGLIRLREQLDRVN